MNKENYMKYNTFVISLTSEHERRAYISSSLIEKNINFSFIEAIDFRNKSDEELKKNQPKNTTSIKRDLTKGEVGCALSHIKCYQSIINEDYDYSLIIEDDAEIEKLSNEKIEEIIKISSANEYDIVILGYSKLDKEKEKEFSIFEPIKIKNYGNGFFLGSPWRQWTCGTVGYIISKKSAKKIYTHYSEKLIPFCVADDWGFLERNFDLKILHCRPLLVFENFTEFESSIENDRSNFSKKNKYNFKYLKYIRGFLRRIYMNFQG